METQLRNYGLILEPIVIYDHYVFGGYGSLGGDVLQPDASWLGFLPANESQLNTNGFDPMACATFGTFNALEMLNRRIYNNERNWSDRFLATISGTTHQGNDPHKVAEALRHEGAPNEVDYPYSEDITSWEQFYAPITKQLEILAHAFIDEFAFKHEWVPTTPNYLTQALKYSPIGISVCAWFKDENGLYYRPAGQQDNHWCVLIGFVQDEYWLVYDSYADNGEFVKKLRWDFAFQVAKRYYLPRQVVNEQSWVEYLINLVKAAFGFTKPSEQAPIAPISPVDTPVTPEPPKPTTPAPEPKIEQVYEAAISYLGKDASPSDIAGDEVGCAESLSNVLRKVYPDFPVLVSTARLFEKLKADSRFKATLDFKPGVIVVSPTVGKNIGHCGIGADNQRIMSNESATGLWQNNYSLTNWVSYFRTKHGLRVYFFEPL